MENKIVDLSKMELTELKALAFDILNEMQALQNNLNLVNKEIGIKLQNKKNEELPAEGKSSTKKGA